MYFEQEAYKVRCEWGAAAITYLAPSSDVIIIVDVLSFSTCVDIATARGALIYPYPGYGDRLAEFAAGMRATVAGSRDDTQSYSLSPASLVEIAAGTRLVLPSPNGSALSVAGTAQDRVVLAGCLRNAAAVAAAVGRLGTRILVVPAGERWPDQTLRPSVEDLVGAGCIVRELSGSKSPEAMLAERAFTSLEGKVASTLRACSSGRELIERGFAEDVELAAQVNVSDCAPILVDGAYRISR